MGLRREEKRTQHYEVDTLTDEQVSVYLYAIEVRERECKAMNHEEHAHVQGSGGKSGINPEIMWAIDYVSCLPEDPKEKAIIERAHTLGGGGGRHSKIISQFYDRVTTNQLYNQGRYYLSVKR